MTLYLKSICQTAKKMKLILKYENFFRFLNYFRFRASLYIPSRSPCNCSLFVICTGGIMSILKIRFTL